MKRDIYQKDVPIERVRKMKKESRKSRKWGAACVALAGFLLFLCILQFFHIDSLLTRTGLGLADCGALVSGVQSVPSPENGGRAGRDGAGGAGDPPPAVECGPPEAGAGAETDGAVELAE